MVKITAIRPRRGRQKRVNIALDNRFAFSLDAEVAVKERLTVGQELSEEQINSLTRSDGLSRCLNASLNYLSYRPRSESEVRERLWRRGFDKGNIAEVVKRLKERGLIDDLAFAQFWKDNRDSFRPRSQRLIKLELKQKGVANSVIDEVVNSTDDIESAYRAALDKARGLTRFDYETFRHRLGEYLKRRGFGYGTISQVVEKVWQEKTSPVD